MSARIRPLPPIATDPPLTDRELHAAIDAELYESHARDLAFEQDYERDELRRDW